MKDKILFASSIIIASFFYGEIAFASIWFPPIITSYDCNHTSCNTPATNFTPPNTGYGTDYVLGKYVNSVSVWMKGKTTASCKVGIYLEDEAGNFYYSVNTVNSQTFVSTYSPYAFLFLQPNTVSFNDHQLARFGLTADGVKDASCATGSDWDTIELSYPAASGTDSQTMAGSGASALGTDYNIYAQINDQYATDTWATNISTSTLAGTFTCPSTSFKINFGVGAVDFGQGVCSVAGFLIVPPASVTNSFSSSTDNLKTKIPFSYFYSLQSDIASSTVSTSTVPVMSITMPSSSPIHFTAVLFSSSTITEFIPSSALNAFRLLAEAAIWLSVAWAIYKKITAKPIL